jgi:hypothetical protein
LIRARHGHAKAMTSADEKRWLAGLESRGNIKLLVLLQGMDTHDAEAAVPGIVGEPPHPPRSFVEAWLVAHEDATTRRSLRIILWRLAAIAIAAASVAAAIIASWPSG